MEIISSKDNKKIKYIRSLLEKGSIRKKSKTFVVEGIKLTDEALECGKVVEIVCAKSLYDEIISGDLSGNRLLVENDKNITNYVKKEVLCWWFQIRYLSPCLKPKLRREYLQ